MGEQKTYSDGTPIQFYDDGKEISEGNWGLMQLQNKWKKLEEFDLESIDPNPKVGIVHVDTRDFGFTVGEPNGWKIERCDCNPTRGFEYLTLRQCLERLKSWKERGFSWIHYSDKIQRCHLNNPFKYVRLVRTPKGWLWCFSSGREEDKKYIAVPNYTIEKYMKFGKTNKI